MSLRPLNDTIVIKQHVERYVGNIRLPEKNSVEKISPFAEIISHGAGCKRKYKIGTKVIVRPFCDKPMWVDVNGGRYRLIREHYLLAECIDD